MKICPAFDRIKVTGKHVRVQMLKRSAKQNYSYQLDS